MQRAISAVLPPFMRAAWSMVTAKAAELRVTGHSATSLPSYLLCFLDSGGSDLVFTLSKQIAVALMYVQFEADFDRFTVRANI